MSKKGGGTEFSCTHGFTHQKRINSLVIDLI